MPRLTNCITRRYLLEAAAAPLLLDSVKGVPAATTLELPQPEIVGGLIRLGPGKELAQSTYFRGEKEGAGLLWMFAKDHLVSAKYLSADFLLNGDTLTVFALSLQEGASGQVFRLVFGGLNECSFRLRMPLELVNQNILVSDREGALLLPMTDGDIVDLSLVDRMILTIHRKAPAPVSWCMTPLSAVAGELQRITIPVLPKGPLLDEMGQSTIRHWPTKTRSLAQLSDRLNSQLEQSSTTNWPQHFSRWGGWITNKISEGGGYFRTHHDGRRWWLVWIRTALHFGPPESIVCESIVMHDMTSSRPPCRGCQTATATSGKFTLFTGPIPAARRT